MLSKCEKREGTLFTQTKLNFSNSLFYRLCLAKSVRSVSISLVLFTPILKIKSLVSVLGLGEILLRINNFFSYSSQKFSSNLLMQKIILKFTGSYEKLKFSLKSCFSLFENTNIITYMCPMCAEICQISARIFQFMVTLISEMTQFCKNLSKSQNFFAK